LKNENQAGITKGPETGLGSRGPLISLPLAEQCDSVDRQ